MLQIFQEKRDFQNFYMGDQIIFNFGLGLHFLGRFLNIFFKGKLLLTIIFSQL